MAAKFNTSLLEKLKKNTTIKEADVLSTSQFFEPRDFVSVPVPMINVALSGMLNGGFIPGLTMWAGPSKHFKTRFLLLMVAAYLKKYPDAICLFYDSEFGSPQSYFESSNIDPERVFHTPIMNIEELKFDVMQQLENINKNDHVILAIDSIGNLASKKEVEDALKGSSAADMTRAKQLKSLFRMVTPHLVMKELPMVVVNHTYKEQALFPKDIVSGGTGGYYSSDNIFILGRQQEKDDGELKGYNFVINVEKSRFVEEKSRILIEVSFEGGISVWSGLLENALESGHVVKVDPPKSGRGTKYSRVNSETGEIEDAYFKEDQTDSKTFWLPVLQDKKFQAFIENKYKLKSNNIITDEELENVYGAT